MTGGKANRAKIADANRFNILKDDVEEHEIDSQQQGMTKFPPIIIAQKLINIKATHQKIKEWVPTVHFRTTASQEQQVLTYSAADFGTVKDELKASDMEFYSFTPFDEKRYRVVLKGIGLDYSIDEIKADLVSKCSDVLEVTQMKSMRDSKETLLPMYAVTVKAICKYNQLKKMIYYCCDHRISLELFRKPRVQRGTQCFRCQRYGHS